MGLLHGGALILLVSLNKVKKFFSSEMCVDSCKGKKINRAEKELIDGFILYIKSSMKLKIDELNDPKINLSRRDIIL